MNILKFGKTKPTVRKVKINEINYNFYGNTITNTKYTWWNYIFLTIFEQFSVRLNLYILLLACLQLWAVIAPIHPLAVWIPLSVILFIGVARETVDDFSRRLRDREANYNKVTVVRKGEKKDVYSYQIRVGDLVYVENGKEIRSDLVLVHSSHPKGFAYVETSTVDGETDLKLKKVPKQILEINPVDLSGEIDCSSPNDKIHEFDSTMKIKENNISLSSEQLLLQGCYLRNTDYIYGIAVYTGNETKVSKSKTKIKIKNSRNENFVSNLLFFTLMIQVTFAIILGFVGTYLRFTTNPFYFGFAKGYQWYEPIVPPLRYFLLLAFLLPPSIKSTRDVAKFFLSWMIGLDPEMYDENRQFKCMVNNFGICEDLGNIEYIFTDKTGTLTENTMKLKKLSINDQEFTSKNEIIDKLQKGDEKLTYLMRNLVICNSVIVKNDNNKLIYQSSSPEEEAFVNYASKLGVVLEAKDENFVEITMMGKKEKYSILKVIGFTSDRKRMTVIFKNEEKILVLCKGADERIMMTLKSEENMEEEKKMINKFAKEGYRTLCMSYKYITQEEYDKWSMALDEAELEVLNRKEKLDQVHKMMEKDFEYLGSTAIEDALQEDVPHVISNLRKAGIVVYMLTGDKLETAVQIGYNCQLLTPDCQLIILREIKMMEEITNKMTNYALVIDGSLWSEIEKDKRLKNKFVELAKDAISVICCRLSPKNKGEIVKVMKTGSEILGTRKRVLAIGDGGNDVPMLRKADIGIGIAGKEGRAAVRVSDFAFSKFKYLLKLLFVHGRNSNTRMSGLTLFSLYKSLMVAMSQGLFSAFCNFSGVALILTFPITLFNTVLTSTLPFCWALQRDLSNDTLLTDPKLYKESQRIINPWIIITTFLYAFYQTGITAFFVLYLGAGDMTFITGGRTFDYWNISFLTLTVIMIVQVLMAVILVKSIDWFVCLYGVFSIVIYFFTMYLWCESTTNTIDVMFGTFQHHFTNISSYAIVLIAVACCILPVVVYRAIEYLLSSQFNYVEVKRIEENDKFFTEPIQEKELKGTQIDLIETLPPPTN